MRVCFPIYLQDYLEHVHDIGTHKCTYCHENRNSSIPYDDTELGEQVRICRKCFNKSTGKVVNSRIELRWRQHLERTCLLRGGHHNWQAGPRTGGSTWAGLPPSLFHSETRVQVVLGVTFARDVG